jgi:hypothetical protein
VLFRTFDDPAFSDLARFVSVVVVTATLCAVAVFVLQSMLPPSSAAPPVSPTADALGVVADDDGAAVPVGPVDTATPYLNGVEVVCVLIFSMEYFVRVATAKHRLRFILRAASIVDFLTILPYYLDEYYTAFHPQGGIGSSVRVLRVMRLFRLLQVTKYIPYVDLMWAAARGSVAPVLMAFFVMGVGVLSLAFAQFYAERGEWDAVQGLWVRPEPAQGWVRGADGSIPGTVSSFQSLGACCYWAIVTLTTVGYGDLYPSTPWGKTIGFFTCLSGCVLISFPVAIYTDEFGKCYAGHDKRRRLRSELRGLNLVELLIKTQADQLMRPELPRFPVVQPLREARHPTLPRNMQMWRGLLQASRARRKASSAGSSVAPARGASLSYSAAAAPRMLLAPRRPVLSVSSSPSARLANATPTITDHARSGAPSPWVRSRFSSLGGVEALDLMATDSPQSMHPQPSPSPPDASLESFSDVWNAGALLYSQTGTTQKKRASLSLGSTALGAKAAISSVPGLLSPGPVALPPLPPAVPILDVDTRNMPQAEREQVEMTQKLFARLSNPGLRKSDCTDSRSGSRTDLDKRPSEGTRKGDLKKVRSSLVLEELASKSAARKADVARGQDATFKPTLPRIGIVANEEHHRHEPNNLWSKWDDPSVSQYAGALPSAAPVVSASNARAKKSSPEISGEDELEGILHAAAAALEAKRSMLLAQMNFHASDPSRVNDTSRDQDLARLRTLPQMRIGEYGLRASSFSYDDLADDQEVENAILELVSDFRKRVWAEVRMLETRFRDDLCVEIARRWQVWMSMPRDAVMVSAAPYIFRKRDLAIGLSFKRQSTGFGFVPVDEEEASLPTPPRAQSSSTPWGFGSGLATVPEAWPMTRLPETPTPAGTVPVENSTIVAATEAPAPGRGQQHPPALLRSLVGLFDPTSDASVQARVQEIGTSAGALLQSLLPTSLLDDDEPEDYHLRIQKKFADVLGEEAFEALAETPSMVPGPLTAYGGGSAGTNAMPSGSPGSESKGVQPSGRNMASSEPGNLRPRDLSIGEDIVYATPEQHALVQAGTHEWNMTPFGLSLIPKTGMELDSDQST